MTEGITGCNLPALQLMVAMGIDLSKVPDDACCLCAYKQIRFRRFSTISTTEYVKNCIWARISTDCERVLSAYNETPRRSSSTGPPARHL